MLLGNGSSTERPRTQSGVSTSADSGISAAIRQQYTADSELAGYTIGIRTVSGAVVLTGTVGSYGARDKAVQIARNTNGVRDVTSRIVVNTNL